MIDNVHSTYRGLFMISSNNYYSFVACTLNGSVLRSTKQTVTKLETRPFAVY